MTHQNLKKAFKNLNEPNNRQKSFIQDFFIQLLMVERRKREKKEKDFFISLNPKNGFQSSKFVLKNEKKRERQKKSFGEIK